MYTSRKIRSLFILMPICAAFILLPVLLLKIGKDSSDKIDASNTYTNKELSGIEVLESTDFNSDSLRFKLHVQAHAPFSSTPQKISLIDKSTKKVKLELNLIQSDNTEECMPHAQVNMKMEKWDTEWFTVPEIKYADSKFTSKLTDLYIIGILYQDWGSVDIYSTNKTISGVCYQVSEATPMVPEVEDEKIPIEY